MFILFLPCELFQYRLIHLYGTLVTKDDSTSIVYIKELDKSPNKINYLGDYINKKEWNQIKLPALKLKFLLKEDGTVYEVNENEPILILIYDKTEILKHELLQTSQQQIKKNKYEFGLLVREVYTQRHSPPKLGLFMRIFFKLASVIVDTHNVDISQGIENYLIQYSCCMQHISNVISGLRNCLSELVIEKRMTVVSKNYFSALFMDVILGIFILHKISEMSSNEKLEDAFLNSAKVIVNELIQLLSWLMGSPAGLKLNHQLNTILGEFFRYHIELWWTFLELLRPVLGYIFNLFTILGYFGVTFQASILADLLSLVTFHAYCIYAYAAKIYSLQVTGLKSLWRLFLGKKKNPLRKRVDSCHYNHFQLFIGTIIFTILLLLLPTSLLYYSVFTVMRLIIVFVGGCLITTSSLLHKVPVYTTFLWIFNSESLKSALILQTLSMGRKRYSALVTTVRQSYWKTCKLSIPNYVSRSETQLNLENVFTTLLSGHLFHPFVQELS